ncbi:hypothetical protein BT96DRAFT_1009766 [Gymnopus androsaceus JB14]|uniref:Uncharacterized protein n=1 Tax=Gymnopus androsaceus JB14 TaxID=1447944 RepID=A0A6A4GBX3_9AGAR|nr:hypothetical protein BT96DRAFT_1009766 [Gymnopus androsaceus JB14]
MTSTPLGYSHDQNDPRQLIQNGSDAYNTPISAPHNPAMAPRQPHISPMSNFPVRQMGDGPGSVAYIQNHNPQSSIHTLPSFPQSISNTFQNVVPHVHNFFQQQYSQQNLNSPTPLPASAPNPKPPVPTVPVCVPTVTAPTNQTPILCLILHLNLYIL